MNSLAGADRGGHRHQAGHGEDDLGGDGRRVEQVPPAVVMSGAHQPAGAVPVHIQRGGAGRDLAAGPGRRRVAGQEPLLGQLPEEGAGRRVGFLRAGAGLQLAADARLGVGQGDGLLGAVVDQQLVAAPAAARLLVELHP